MTDKPLGKSVHNVERTIRPREVFGQAKDPRVDTELRDLERAEIGQLCHNALCWCRHFNLRHRSKELVRRALTDGVQYGVTASSDVMGTSPTHKVNDGGDGDRRGAHLVRLAGRASESSARRLRVPDSETTGDIERDGDHSARSSRELEDAEGLEADDADACDGAGVGYGRLVDFLAARPTYNRDDLVSVELQVEGASN
jgi:hypothetical protein